MGILSQSLALSQLQDDASSSSLRLAAASLDWLHQCPAQLPIYPGGELLLLIFFKSMEQFEWVNLRNKKEDNNQLNLLKSLLGIIFWKDAIIIKLGAHYLFLFLISLFCNYVCTCKRVIFWTKFFVFDGLISGSTKTSKHDDDDDTHWCLMMRKSLLKPLNLITACTFIVAFDDDKWFRIIKQRLQSTILTKCEEKIDKQ